MSTPPTPLQVNFSTGLLQEMIASDEVIVSVEDGLQVAPFRNPWNNNAIEALVIIDATNGSGSLMHLAQDQTVATGWSLTPIVDSNGETVQAAGVVCCADTWWGVDAFYTAPGQQQIFHIWMTESGTDWTTASQLILTVEGEGEEITNLSIVYSPGASNASGVTMLAAEWSSQHVVNAFVYAGIDGWWHSAAFAAGGTCVGDWNSPVVIQDYNQDSGTWSGTLVVPSGTPLGNFTYCDAFCQIEFDGNQIQATPMAGSWLVDSTAIAGTIALSGNQDTFSGMVVTTDELVQNQTWLRPLSNSNSYSYNFGALSPVAWDGNLQHIAMLASSTGSIYLYLIDGNQVLWVLNSTSDVLPQWSPAIALDTPIMQIYADQMPWDSPALFAVDPGGVLHLHYQDPNTGFWATGPVKLSTTNQYDVTRWRTVASVYDANGNPVPNYPVTVAADSACDIAVGAEYYFIDSQTTMQVSTDAQGRTTFATVATSLSAPTLTLTVGETTSSSSPSIAVNDYFAGTGFLPGMPPFSGSVLASAQNAAGNGPLAPGLSDNGGSGPSGDQMAQYMAETAQMPTGGTTSARSGGERFVVLHKDPAGQRSVAELSSRDEVDAYLTRLGVPVGGATDSAWGDIANWAGDVWRGIKNAVIEVTTITFDFGENVLSITMDGIDDVLQWVVNTVEDALNAMHALFNWIDTKFDDLINWLKAVFNLGHIWDTKVAFTTLMGDVQTTLNDMLGWAQDWVYRLSGVRGFVTAGLNKAVSSYGQQTIGGIPNMNQATSPPSTTPFPGQSNGAQVSPSTVSTHPQATWFQDQVAANPPEGFQPSSPAQEWQDLLNSIDNAADGFADAVRSLGSALADAYNDAGGDLRQVTLADFVAGWKQSSCEVFLEQFGEDLLTALIQAGEVIVSSTFDALSQPLPDGLVSTLYGWVASAAGASSSSPPSLLDLACLLLAAPVTVVYSMMYDGAEPFPGGSVSAAAVVPGPDDDAPQNSGGIAAGLLQFYYVLVDMANDTCTVDGTGSGKLLTLLSIAGPAVITALEWPGGIPPQEPSDELSIFAGIAWGLGFLMPLLNGVAAALTGIDKTAAQLSLPVAGILGFLGTIIAYAFNISYLVGEADAGGQLPSWEAITAAFIRDLPTLGTFLLAGEARPYGLGLKCALDVIGDMGGGILQSVGSSQQ